MQRVVLVLESDVLERATDCRDIPALVSNEELTTFPPLQTRCKTIRLPGDYNKYILHIFLRQILGSSLNLVTHLSERELWCALKMEDLRRRPTQRSPGNHRESHNRRVSS